MAFAGLAVSQAACAGASDPAGGGTSMAPVASSPSVSSAPASSPASSPSASASGTVFSGDRQTRLLPEESEATFRVGSDLTVERLGQFHDRALFVLTNLGDHRYWIQTATLRAGGEAYCLSTGDAEKAFTPVKAVACDSSDTSQIFRFREQGEAQGKMTYTIYSGEDKFLITDEQGDLLPGGTGAISAVIGEGTPDIDTTFFLPDAGEASLPELD